MTLIAAWSMLILVQSVIYNSAQSDLAKSAQLTLNDGTSQDITKITDGDDTTCTVLTDSSFSLRITWTSNIYFTWLRIVVGTAELQKEHISVKFHDDFTTPSLECIKHYIDNITMDIYCNILKPIREIFLIGSSVNTLCSLYVSKGRNLALKQPTNQTTTDANFASYNSSSAVDGNINWADYSCTHTMGNADPAPTWTLYFQSIVTVSSYTIYNRVDAERCCLDRLKGFILTTFNQTNNIVQNYTDTGTSALEMYNVLSSNPWAKVSKVQIKATNPSTGLILTLCEVEIFGDSVCPRDELKYGRNCENICNCVVPGEKCSVSTGNCPSGCKAGFYGQGCNKTCDFGYFGIDCRNKCSNCSGRCEGEDGKCTSCATKGTKLPYCTEDCDFGTYGSDCKSNCSQNCSQTGSICDVLEGKCFACKPGFYGTYCTSPCSSNCKDPVCDINSGNCKSCKAGFQGDQCVEECSDSTYGEDCKANCSTNCNTNSTGARLCENENGHCLNGCRSGFEGLDCSTLTSATLDNGDDNDTTIIGAVVGSICGLFVVFLIGGAFFFWRRHKKSDQISGKQNTRVENLVIEADSQDQATFSSKLEKKEGSEKVKPQVPEKPKAMISEDGKSSEQTGTEYYNTVNLQPITSSTVITLSNLQSYLLTHSKEYLHKQFTNLPDNVEATMMVGLSAENKIKNRYKNICAYDHSRVHLEADSTKMHGDYINASYLKGYKEEEKFIASQGPTKYMLNDFIRMIWEQKVEKVVMLTKLVEDGKSKCDPYWPDEGESTFGEIRVRLAATQVFADYIIRRLQFYMDSQPMHPVTQFHFTSWPDKGVPENPWALVDFEQRVAAIATKRPIVVHCSAGVGRTGTFIALRNVMREAEDTQQMDFFNTVAKLRQDRTMMIQTAEQYVFLHEAAKVAMTCINTTVTSNNIANRVHQLEKKSISGKTEMEKEFDAVCSVCVEESQFTDEEGSAGIMYQNSRSVSNKLKNRFGNILPKEIYRPVLMCESSGMENYINAVLTPSFRKRNQNIITQLPLPTTVVDFWRLITQMKISLVVAFEEELQDKDSTIGEYLPTSDKEKASFPPFQVSMGTWHQSSDWEERKLIVTTSKDTEEHSLIHFRYKQTSTDPKQLLPFIKQTRTYDPKQDARTLYMCRNGATFSGLACVLTLLLDRMDNDQRLTVPLVVGAIKTIRTQVIPTLEQYKILYQVLQRYNETNSVYYNFSETKLSVVPNDDAKENIVYSGNEGTEYANSKV